MNRYPPNISDEFRQSSIERTRAMIAEAEKEITELRSKHTGAELVILLIPWRHMIDEWNEDLKELEQ